jgi:hypothetical protein
LFVVTVSYAKEFTIGIGSRALSFGPLIVLSTYPGFERPSLPLSRGRNVRHRTHKKTAHVSRIFCLTAKGSNIVALRAVVKDVRTLGRDAEFLAIVENIKTLQKLCGDESDRKEAI